MPQIVRRAHAELSVPDNGADRTEAVGQTAVVLDDIWPMYAMAVSTPRVTLRLPTDAELGELARLAGAGVHTPEDRPFLTPWTEGSAIDRAQFVLREHWGQLAGWDVRSWRLGMGVFSAEGAPLGMVTLRARDFPVVREVTTSSWLGLSFHGVGLGTEARVGLLSLAFDHLGAEAALTEVFQDNHASQGVSRKLGYEPDGISRDARGAEVLVSDRLRLTAEKWRGMDRLSVRVTGIEQCRQMFTG
jgi:RimJ/RimL family protein N-acetyltransferase